MRVIARGDTAYLVALRPPHLAATRPDAVQAWVLNIRADPNVVLRLPGGTLAGIAREITDHAELGQAQSAICDSVHPMDYGECALHLRGLPSRQKIRALHRYWFDTGIPLAIDLGEQS